MITPPSASWMLQLTGGWVVVTQRVLPAVFRPHLMSNPRNRHLWWHPKILWLIVERGNALGSAYDSESLLEEGVSSAKFDRLEACRQLQTVSLRQALRISRLSRTEIMGRRVPRRAREVFPHVPLNEMTILTD